MIIIGIIIFQAIITFGHYFVYKTIVYSFRITSLTTLVWLKYILLALSISFILASLVTFFKFSLLGKFFYTLAAVWLGTLYWLVLASVLIWIMLGFLQLIALNIDARIIAKVLIMLAFLISFYGVWNSYQVKIINTDIEIADLPAKWENKKVILISDTHFGNIRNVSFSKKITKLINDQRPDIVLIAGDFFDGTPVNIDQVLQPFNAVNSVQGVYFAPGNHEEMNKKISFIDSFKKTKIQVLNNKKIDINGLQVIGVDYSSTITPEDQRMIFGELAIDRDQPSILIRHVPTNTELAAEYQIDLQVSGHTHKGQIFPLNYLTKSVYGRFHYGLSSLKGTQVYTTSGVGTWGPPQRVGTFSEIIVITLKNED